MNFFERRDGALMCEGVSLDAIAAAVGTPTYVYSAATLRRHYRVFAEAFAEERPLIAFAVKANSNVAVLATLAALGAGADTVSQGEIKRALKAGVPPERVIFSGVGKTAEELAFAASLGVRQINVESIAELDALAEAAAATADRRAGPQAIAIRVNPDVGAGAHGKISTGGRDSKFGVGPQEALALHARAGRLPHLAPQGFAVHIGSQIKDLGAFEQAFQVLRDLTLTARAQGGLVRQLDLGGGLGVPYFDADQEPPPPDAYAAIARRAVGDLDVGLVFEPGRLIAANSGVLLTRVVRLQERAERRIVVLDAAMNDLVRPAMYDAYHDLQPVSGPAGALGGTSAPMDLVGPVCESGDTFAKARMLPPLKAGDLCAFMTAGAYGASMSSTYNARPLVAEVLVDGDRFALVRRRWTVEEQLALETIPDWV